MCNGRLDEEVSHSSRTQRVNGKPMVCEALLFEMAFVRACSSLWRYHSRNGCSIYTGGLHVLLRRGVAVALPLDLSHSSCTCCASQDICQFQFILRVLTDYYAEIQGKRELNLGHIKRRQVNRL
jgi:hypothetical protein